MSVLQDATSRWSLDGRRPLCTTHGAVPSLWRSKWLAASVARRAIDTESMMKKRVWVRFLEAGDLLVRSKSLLAEAFRMCLRQRALMFLSVLLDLRNRVCQMRRDPFPFVFREHRDVYSTAPAVDLSWHECGLTFDLSGWPKASPLEGRVRPQLPYDHEALHC